jgi:peptide/nickel transport system substrate-binding protein
MKARISARAVFALASASAIAVTGVIVAPAHAATKTTVVMTEPTPINSLNYGVNNMNLASNEDLTYPTGFGFYWANDQKQVVPNTKFGSWKIAKNSATDFEVAYTVNPGQIWDDGAPITGVDLLLSHVTSSGKYSIAAGLGDPQSKAGSAFDSGGYGGVYDSHVVGNPTLSADKMTLTVKYDARIPDWALYAPGVSPVHALELMAAGKKTLPSVAEANAATDKFLSDFTSKNTASLKAMAAIWSKSYNISTVNSSTNPLLLVGNGDFKIDTCVDQVACTLVIDSKTNGTSGPKTTGIEKIVFRYDVADTSAPQALGNKEVDLYQGQPTADAVTQLKAVKGISILAAPLSTYEQMSMRVGSGTGGTYTGPFAGESAKAIATRKAFLLALPREDMVNKIVAPVQANAVVLNSRFVLPDSSAAYAAQIAGNGSSAYTAGTQASRTAQAIRIMKQYYGADFLKKPITVHTLFRNNARRTAEFQLYQAAEAAVGFNMTGPGIPDWSKHTSDDAYDVNFYAWGNGLPVQVGDCPQVQTTGGNNHYGWSNATIDKVCADLATSSVSDATRNAKWIQVERAMYAEAYTIGLFQWPGVTAVNSDLKGVKPSSITPNLVWNYWEWTY